MLPRIDLRRAYDPPQPDEGKRVLIDRLWPRGVAREMLRFDLWPKDIAPSPALRKWFAHDPARWPEFSRRYRAELVAQPDGLAPLLALCRAGPVTLLYGARDRAHSHALVLRQHLRERLAQDDAVDPEIAKPGSFSGKARDA